MFLPVLLVRDHGLWGWVVFAVPNVVAPRRWAWVLRDAAASERFVHRHRGACRAFSRVTIAYHIFFAMWMIERLKGWGLLTLGICIVAALLPGRDYIRFFGAAFAMIASLVAWWMLDQQGMLQLPSIQPLRGRRQRRARHGCCRCSCSALRCVHIWISRFIERGRQRRRAVGASRLVSDSASCFSR